MADSDASGDSETARLRARHLGVVPGRLEVDFGAFSHRGLVRTNNEDHYAIVRRSRSREVLFTNLPAEILTNPLQEAYVMTVADGMGGNSFGEIASMLALRSGWDLTSGAYKWHFSLEGGQELREAEEILQLYGKLIHRSLREAGEEHPKMRGMGTTIACVILAGSQAVVAHAGDSRVYLLREGRLYRLTRDHTLAEFLKDAGQLPLDEEASGHLRGVLVNCLGGSDPKVEIETSRVPLQKDDRLLLCTDGLSDLVPDADIAEVLRSAVDAQAAAASLGEQALRNGGRDNVTVVVGRVRSTG